MKGEKGNSSFRSTISLNLIDVNTTPLKKSTIPARITDTYNALRSFFPELLSNATILSKKTKMPQALLHHYRKNEWEIFAWKRDI